MAVVWYIKIEKFKGNHDFPPDLFEMQIQWNKPGISSINPLFTA